MKRIHADLDTDYRVQFLPYLLLVLDEKAGHGGHKVPGILSLERSHG